MRARLLLSVAVVLIAVIAVSSMLSNVYAFDLELYEDGILSDGIIEQGRLIRVQVVTAPGNTNYYRYIWTHPESGTTLDTGTTPATFDVQRINILGDWNIKVEFYYYGDKVGEATTSFRIVSADYNIELLEGDDLSPSDGTIPQGSLIRANAVTTNPTVNNYRYIWTHPESGTTLDTGTTPATFDVQRINILGDWNIKVEFYYYGDKVGEATTSFRIVSADYNIELLEGDDLSPSDGTIPQGSLIRANAVTTNPTVNNYRYIWTHPESGTTLDTGTTPATFDVQRINILGDWNIKVEFYYYGDKVGEATTSFRIVSADYNIELLEGDDLSPSDGTIPQGSLIRANAVTTNPTVNNYRYIWTHPESGTTLDTGTTPATFDVQRINILGDWNIKVEFYYYGDKVGEATTSFRIVSADYNIELLEGDDLSPSDGTIPQGSLIRANAVTTNPTVNNYRYIWTHPESGTTLDTGTTPATFDVQRINILGDWNIKVEFYYYGDKVGEATTSFRIVSADYNIELLEGDHGSDYTINLGQEVRAKATTNDSRVVNVKFRWIDPSNNEARTNTVNIVNGEASDTFTPTSSGIWTVKAEFTDSSGSVTFAERTVTFTVAISSATLTSPTGTGNITVSAGTGTVLTSVSAQPVPSGNPPPVPSGAVSVNLPHGLIAFSANTTPGDFAVIQIQYPSLPSLQSNQYLTYFKLVNGTWKEVKLNDTGNPDGYFTLSGTTVTLYIKDNGDFDANSALGVVSDPGGIAVVTTTTQQPPAGGGGGGVASDEYVFDFKFGSNLSADGQFRYPFGVAYDHNNNRIIVADTENNRIQVFDSNGNFLFKFGNFGSDDGQFIGPHGIAYDPNNNRIIVADTFNDRIQVFDSNGNFLFKFGNFGFADGQFNSPHGIAYDHNNNRIIVADTWNHRIQVFDSNGNFLFKFGNFGFADGQFAYPYGIAYDHNNNRIIVADTFNDRIQVFDSNGNFLFKFGSNLSADGQFAYPYGIAYDHNNNRIIVADTWNHRIQVFDSNGNFLFKFGNFGSDDGQFIGPHGIAYDPNNNRIIVADTFNDRIQVFDSNGNFLFKFGNFGFADGQFIGPHGIAYDPNNNRIIVADTFNDRIQVFDSNGNFLFKFGNFGFADGQFNSPYGIAYDP
jgi:DNA-binding beta-propeller fold protein YncE